MAGSQALFSARANDVRNGLRDLGYVEGRDITYEYRWSGDAYEQLPALAAELVALNVDVLVSHGTPGTQAAKQATTRIPIVMANSGDAVATGLVASLARPGGNITGSTYFNPELSAKRLELLTEMQPKVRRVGVLVNPANPINGPVLVAMEEAAKSLNITLENFPVRNSPEFAAVFAALAAIRIDAVAITDDSMLTANGRLAANLSARHRLPSCGFAEFARVGGLVGYGVSFRPQFYRAAYFIDRILKGAQPEDLPVEQATKFELVINLRTAKALGLTVPSRLLATADEVIE